MKDTRVAPIPRSPISEDYERFFDNYYNLGPPSRIFEPAAAPERRLETVWRARPQRQKVPGRKP